MTRRQAEIKTVEVYPDPPPPQKKKYKHYKWFKFQTQIFQKVKKNKEVRFFSLNI